MISYVSGLVVRFWAWLCSWYRRAEKPLGTVLAEELPDKLDRNVVYVLGEGKHRWFVALTCPCGCGNTLQVSLLPDSKPRWRLIEHADDGTVTVEPSIWREVGCRSHFFLRRGRIQWCDGR
jgi:hypothetical protein